jgi:hypothetical protein
MLVQVGRRSSGAQLGKLEGGGRPPLTDRLQRYPYGDHQSDVHLIDVRR